MEDEMRRNERIGVVLMFISLFGQTISHHNETVANMGLEGVFSIVAMVCFLLGVALLTTEPADK
jgi:threonine/homoserine/homoserine lactone efflux protein